MTRSTVSFWDSGTSTSLKSGLPSRETWTNGPVSSLRPKPGSQTRAFCRLAVVQMPTLRRGQGRVGRRDAVGGDVGDRHLDRDAVHVGGRESSSRPAPRCRGRQPERVVQVGDRSQVAQVKDGAEVDEERLGSLTGEDHAAVRHRVHRGTRERRVVRRRQRADVARRARDVLGQQLRPSVGRRRA